MTPTSYRSIHKVILYFILLIALMAFYSDQQKITVYMMGDSTMSIKSPNKFPETGWGMAFSQKVNENVTVINKARDGRSTKLFINEGIWSSVYENLNPGDYVFIQFGHNDEVVNEIKALCLPFAAYLK